jgi:hypothetical protein
VCRQANGLALLRLLELQDHILGLGSLEVALRAEGAFRIRAFGLADPLNIDSVADAVIAGVKR